MREDPRLPRRALGLRAAHVRARAGRGRPRDRGVHARLLPPGAGSLPRGDGDEAVARHAQEPQAAQAPRALSGRQVKLFYERDFERLARATACGRPPELGRSSSDERIGEVYLSRGRDRGAGRASSARELARDYAGREPLLVGSLKACVAFVADLSRAMPIAARARLRRARRLRRREPGGHERIRLPEGPRPEIAGRDVLLVDEVVDTGLTLHYLAGARAARAGVARMRDALRPAVPAARRRPADPLRRLHGPGRVLRRLRLRPRRALAEPARPPRVVRPESLGQLNFRR